MRAPDSRDLLWDVVLLAVSVGFAIVIARSGLLIAVLAQTRELRLAGSFVAGMFFTSIFTAPPAIAALGELAQINPPWVVGLLGGAGAVVGDLIIFRFVKDRFSAHLLAYVRLWGGTARFERFLLRRSSRWLAYAIAVIVIASPFPDELGIALLGATGMPLRRFLPLSFVLNALGIFLIALAARAL